jgi:long-subunit fatty acid transport protein
MDIEEHFMYSNSNLLGNHLKAKIRPFHYFYLQTDFRQLHESDPVNNTSDQLSLFHFTFCYDRIRMEKFNFGWTLGASYVGNEVNKTGFSYGLNADFFLNNRISFSGSSKWSKINGRPVNALEVKARYHLKRYLLSVGYEHLKIATPTYNFVSVGGGIYF